MPSKIPVYLLRTNKIVEEALVDDDVYQKLKNYRYFITNHSTSPQREVKSIENGRKKKHIMFLRRDIMGFKHNDGQTVDLVKPQKRYDFRRSNLRQGADRKRTQTKKSSSGYTWPYNFKSFRSFFAAKNENKIIDLVDLAENYEYKKGKVVLYFRHDEDININETRLFLQRNVLKYFDNWKGDIHVCKSGVNKELQTEYENKILSKMEQSAEKVEAVEAVEAVETVKSSASKEDKKLKDDSSSKAELEDSLLELMQDIEDKDKIILEQKDVMANFQSQLLKSTKTDDSDKIRITNLQNKVDTLRQKLTDQTKQAKKELVKQDEPQKQQATMQDLFSHKRNEDSNIVHHISNIINREHSKKATRAFVLENIVRNDELVPTEILIKVLKERGAENIIF